MSVPIVAGFSLTNRLLLYASVLLAPAHFAAGFDTTGLSNLGFLAYNWYNQITWQAAVTSKELHAVSMLPTHFNTVYALSYLGGVGTGNLFTGLIVGLGTAGVLILNTVAAWQSWAIDQPEGFGVYQFFFFGWRTLNRDWHTFFLVWQIGDSFFAFAASCFAVAIPFIMKSFHEDEEDEKPTSPFKALKTIANLKYPLIPIGAAVMLLITWPLVLWVELIVRRNHIESPTDWISVWLFVAEVGLLMVPSFGGYFHKWFSQTGRD